MTKYRLVYFDFRGKGELARLIFAAAGQDYEDKRLEYSNTSVEWQEYKLKTPFGKLPILEIIDEETSNIKILAQSVSIGRYLGNILGLTGKCDFEKAELDQYADQINEFSLKVIDFLSGTLTEDLFNPILSTNLGYFDKRIKLNNNSYLVGDRLTWVDLYLFNVIDWFEEYSKNKTFEKYEYIKNHYENVKQNKNINEWILKRPITKY